MVNAGWILSAHRIRAHHILSVAIRQNFSFKLFSIANLRVPFVHICERAYECRVCLQYSFCRTVDGCRSITRADKNQPTSQIVYSLCHEMRITPSHFNTNLAVCCVLCGCVQRTCLTKPQDNIVSHVSRYLHIDKHE